MLLAYYGDVCRVSADLSVLPTLSEYRLARLKGTKPLPKKQQGICAELLLYAALRKAAPGIFLPPDIAADEHGKPYLRGSNLFFSLSHSGKFAFCALSDSELGADVQLISRYDPALVSRFFAAGERKYIEKSTDRDLAFTRVWAMKESYIKALGMGLSTPLSSFDVCIDGEPCRHLGAYSFWHTEAEGCVFSLCVKKSDAMPEAFEKLEISLDDNEKHTP